MVPPRIADGSRTDDDHQVNEGPPRLPFARRDGEVHGQFGACSDEPDPGDDTGAVESP